jgi:hypothetical protein
MTSGNRAEESIARDDAEAEARLGGIADAILTHDREIHTRTDDSAFRSVGGIPRPVRRARGLVPDPIALPGPEGPPVLAVGAELEDTVCLVRGGQAFLSPHLGDLAGAGVRALFEEMIEKLSRLLGVTPRAVAHDLFRITRRPAGRAPAGSAACRSSTTTRTWPPASPSTGGPGRSWASPSTGPAAARRASSGAASFSRRTSPVSGASRTSGPSRSPGARRRSASPGGSPARRCSTRVSRSTRWRGCRAPGARRCTGCSCAASPRRARRAPGAVPVHPP